VPDSSESVPLHGYRGTAPDEIAYRPRGLTVAISREAGSNGWPIAQAVGRLLGWQAFDQDVLDFMTQDETAFAELVADVPASARKWADARLATVVAERGLRESSELAEIARFALTLAARGEAVLVGTAAGFLLPSETTVHVRVVAPLERRITQTIDRLRLTAAEAEAEVRSTDRRRAEMLTVLVGRDAGDPVGYDLVLNSARLGVEGCAELIAQAVRFKQVSDETVTPDPDVEPA
jgi:cytidylate kinase